MLAKYALIHHVAPPPGTCFRPQNGCNGSIYTHTPPQAVCLREQLLPLRGDTLLATDRAGSSGAPSEGTASSASASSATPAAATAACPATGTGTTSSSSTTSDVEGARELLRATEHVPMGEHDQPVDFIVTPDGVLSRESESPRGATASASGGAAGSLPVGGAASGG